LEVFFLFPPQTRKKKAKKGRSFFLKGFTVVFDKKFKNPKKKLKSFFLKGFTVVFHQKLKNLKNTLKINK
jgi:hypothetical protein